MICNRWLIDIDINRYLIDVIYIYNMKSSWTILVFKSIQPAMNGSTNVKFCQNSKPNWNLMSCCVKKERCHALPPSRRWWFRKLPSYSIQIIVYPYWEMRFKFNQHDFSFVPFGCLRRILGICKTTCPSKFSTCQGNKFSLGITITPSPSIESLGRLGKGNDKV